MPPIMNKTLNLNTSLENITNIDNSYRPSFPYFLIIFLVYLLLLLVVSNLIAGLIRCYKRSLSYLRINIILSLNHALVEISNTYVTFVVSRFGHFYFFQTRFEIIWAGVSWRVEAPFQETPAYTRYPPPTYEQCLVPIQQPSNSYKPVLVPIQQPSPSAPLLEEFLVPYRQPPYSSQQVLIPYRQPPPTNEKPQASIDEENEEHPTRLQLFRSRMQSFATRVRNMFSYN